MQKTVRISLVALPEAALSTLSGMYEVLSMTAQMAPEECRLLPEIVSPVPGLFDTAFGLPLRCHRDIEECTVTDVVILPSLILEGEQWETGRYPGLVDWLKRQYAGGATLCSACSGVLLLAETGLLDGQSATIHWAFREVFQRAFPHIPLRLEEVLVIGGAGQRFVMSGGSTSWHDLVLYLISRCHSHRAALLAAKFFLLEWHKDGQLPYMSFEERFDHGDRLVDEAQRLMRRNCGRSWQIDALAKAYGLNERTFNRRFRKATGLTPLAYLQALRVEQAKLLLESGNLPVDEISNQIGYEEPAFFRRLFKRSTGLTPSAYRRRFQVPVAGAQPPLASSQAL